MQKQREATTRLLRLSLSSQISGFSYNDSRASFVLVEKPLKPYDVKSMHPLFMECPYCLRTQMTRVQLKTGKAAYATAGACCVFGCWLGCSCAPLCLDTFKEVNHFCRNCDHLIARRHPF